MKNFIKLVTLCFLLLAAGCVSSLNALYTEQDIIFDPDLIGVWTDRDSKETFELTKSGEKQYRLVYTDEEGKSGEFVAHLLKIADKKFMDLTPVKPALSQNDFYREHFVVVHSFAQITETGSTVQISFLEPDWLKTMLVKNPTAIRHEKLGDEIFITASPKELQKFLLAHINTQGAFSKPLSVKRK
jgi:hypothetical protein